jgi:hypothetical protein
MIALVVLALATAAPPTQAPAAQPSDAGGAVRVMSDFRAAVALRGRLEGGWRVIGRRGEGLYLIQLADPDGRPDPGASEPEAPSVEGAWRDLQRASSLDGAGYLAAAKRWGQSLTLLFFEGSDARRIELEADGRGRWRGELFAEGATVPVVMRHEPFFAAAR